MNELVTIRTFSSSIDFEMVRSYLESMGVACFGLDEVMNRAYIANVNGGVKLQVRKAQVEEAITLLIDGGYLKQEDVEPSYEMKWIDRIISKFRTNEE
ncbi:MAG: DUF2007 domain-containing protein [Paludibacter sp.]|nr:DUF2007 domain-containing protein [Paludibacter sp.]